jgi:hypothetical protein
MTGEDMSKVFKTSLLVFGGCAWLLGALLCCFLDISLPLKISRVIGQIAMSVVFFFLASRAKKMAERNTRESLDDGKL